MLHYYRYRYQGNEGVEEIYVACIDNKDLAEVIMKDMNADTEESAPLEENALIPLLDVGNDNTSTQLTKKRTRMTTGVLILYREYRARKEVLPLH